MKRLATLAAAATLALVGLAAPTTAEASTFTKVYGETFDTAAAVGQVGTVYGSNITGYADGTATTSKNGGCYYPSKTESVSGGVLNINVHSETLPDKNGVAGACKFLTAAPVPYGWQNQIYGRFTVRMRADAVAGYKVAFLLWPDSDVWGDGEIDYPEAELTKPVTGAVHHVSPGDPNGYTLLTTSASLQTWHTYSMDWTPGQITMSLDGVVQKTFTSDVPTKAHHWVLQTETAPTAPSISAAGNIQIDAASVYKWTT